MVPTAAPRNAVQRQNQGHIKAVSAMNGRGLDPYIGRAFVGDGIATMVSGGVGGTGGTPYAANMA